MKLSRYCCHDLKMIIFYRGHARLIFTRVMAFKLLFNSKSCLHNSSRSFQWIYVKPSSYCSHKEDHIIPRSRLTAFYQSYAGWSGGAKVLGKLPVPGRPTNLDYSRERAYVLAVGAGGGCLDIFSLIYHFSFLSPSLWETARSRLKYCLKGPLSPNQPTNQSYGPLSVLAILSTEVLVSTTPPTVFKGF